MSKRRRGSATKAEKPTRVNAASSAKRNIRRRPRTAEQFAAKRQASQDAWNRSIEVLSKMRKEHSSLRAASKEVGVRPETVVRLVGSALKKRSNGHYVAKPGDQFLRILRIPTPDGVVEIGVRGSRQASTLGEYWAAAVQKYIPTGDASGVEKFRGKEIRDATGRKFPLVTDLRELDRLGHAGVLSFESLYARTT